MKKPTFPAREASRFDHALTRPLRGLPFFMVELIRADLFEYLDRLTSCHYSFDLAEKLFASKDAEITRTTERLKEVMRFRSAALSLGVKSGTVDHFFVDEDEHAPNCGPVSPPVWEECLEHWQFHRTAARERKSDR